MLIKPRSNNLKPCSIRALLAFSHLLVHGLGIDHDDDDDAHLPVRRPPAGAARTGV